MMIPFKNLYIHQEKGYRLLTGTTPWVLGSADTGANG